MDETPQKSERRQTERIPQSFPIHASRCCSEVVSEESIAGVVCNISGNGLSFLSDAHYTIGDILNLRIDLPCSNHFFKARVAHMEILGDSKIIGVSFVDMSLEHQQALIEALFLKK